MANSGIGKLLTTVIVGEPIPEKLRSYRGKAGGCLEWLG